MGPRICFASFIFAKNNEIVINSTNTEAREKISMDLESLEFHNFLMQISLNLRPIKLFLIKFAADF